MKHTNGHPWHRFACWLLSLGAFCCSLPFVTPSSSSSSLDATCKSHAEGKFQIRALAYTEEYFYLVSSTGQLFVEDGDTFKENLKDDPPTIHLSKPLIDKLSSEWNTVSDSVDYANTKIQFGFTFEHDYRSGQDWLTLMMVDYTTKWVFDNDNLKMCINPGYKFNGKEAPLKIEKNPVPVCVISQGDGARDRWKFDHLEMPAFWLTSKSAMYPVHKLSERKKTQFAIILKYYFGIYDDDGMFKLTGFTEKLTVKPLSGLDVENVGIFVVYQDSTVLLLPDPKQDPDLSMKNKEWPISEFLVLDFCSKATNDSTSKITKKARKKAPKRTILYLGITGCILSIVAVLAVFYLRKKYAPEKAQRLPVSTFSSVISSTIHSLNSNFATHSPGKAELPASAAPKEKPKKKKPTKRPKTKKKKQKKKKSKLPAKESKIKSAQVVAVSQASQRPQLCNVLSPSGASPRSVVTSSLNQLRKSLVSLKHSSSSRHISKPSTSTVSQVSSLPRTQSTD